jgi:hypothetical protein
LTYIGTSDASSRKAPSDFEITGAARRERASGVLSIPSLEDYLATLTFRTAFRKVIIDAPVTFLWFFRHHERYRASSCPGIIYTSELTDSTKRKPFHTPE